MLEHLRKGDVVVVTKYDRLARNLKDLIEVVELINERDAGFRSIDEDINTTTPNVPLVTSPADLAPNASSPRGSSRREATCFGYEKKLSSNRSMGYRHP